MVNEVEPYIGEKKLLKNMGDFESLEKKVEFPGKVELKK